MTLDELFARAPVRTAGRFGKEGDPWNLLFIGSERSVCDVLEAGGWARIPLTILRSIVEGLGDLASGNRLTRFPPMNDYRVEGRVQTHNWAIPVRAIHERHHFRLWKLDAVFDDGRPYWWGSGNYDLDSRYWDLSHRPDPDMDRERDFIAETVERHARVESIERRECSRIPREGANDKGYAFRNDGRVLVVRLKPS
jgi:hypothetical protein